MRTVAVLTGGAFSRAELEEAGAYAVYEDCAELLEAGFPEELKPSAQEVLAERQVHVKSGIPNPPILNRWWLGPSLEGTRHKANPNRLSKGKNMDFNPEDAHQYFEGVDYPASKEDLISAAEANGAPDWLVDRIGTLGRPEFSSSEDVVEELHASPQST